MLALSSLHLAICVVGGLRGWRFARLRDWRFVRLAVCAVGGGGCRLVVGGWVGGWRFAACGLRG